MVNFIWFTDKKCSSCEHLATWRHKIKRLAIRKLNYLSSGGCWCTVLMKGAKLSYSHKCVSDSFGHFCGYNVKTSTVCHQ